MKTLKSAGLEPRRRDLIRERWEIYRNLPPEAQRRIRQNYRDFHRLNQDRRRELRDRWRSMTPAQRERALDRVRDRQRHRPTRRD